MWVEQGTEQNLLKPMAVPDRLSCSRGEGCTTHHASPDRKVFVSISAEPPMYLRSFVVSAPTEVKFEFLKSSFFRRCGVSMVQ
jgi:hypothetical protein